MKTPSWRYALLAGLALLAGCSKSPQTEILDPSPPVVVLENPVQAAAVSLELTVRGTATHSQGVTRVTYQINGGSEQNLNITPGTRVSFSFKVTLQPGLNVIVVNAYNASGNVGQATLRIEYGTQDPSADPYPPDVRITSPTPGTTVYTPEVEVRGEARDNRSVARLTYQLGGGAEQPVALTPGASVAFAVKVSGLIAGSNTILINAYDAAGNKDAASTRVVFSGSSPSPSPTPAPSPTPTPPGPALPALVKAYWINRILDATHTQTSVRWMRYQPRQFQAGLSLVIEPAQQQEADFKVDDPGPYRGWDALILPANGSLVGYSSSDTLLELYLNREARVGLVWYGSPTDRPSWMSDWAQGSTVAAGGKTYPVFLKNLPAGRNLFYGIDRKAGRVYTLLLAEKDGTPSSPPPVPAGRETPVPNTYCPQWVHDQYPGWHPQIDPVYWCYFGHEHGSNPAQYPALKALIDSGQIQLNFGQVEAAGNATPMCVSCHQQKLGKSVVNAPKESFKLFALDDRQGHLWLIKFQLSSHNRARLCQRHHEYGIWAVDSGSGELLAALQFAADFGPALNGSVGNNTYYKPDLCPENLDIPMNNDQGRHRIPLISASGYENWTPHFPAQLGFFGYGRSYNLDNPMTRCSDERDAQGYYTCNQAVRALDPNDYNWGENRWFIIPGADQPDGGFGIRAFSAIASGRFCTDVLGTALRDCSAADAVPQYIKPGLNILHKDPFRWIPYDPWWVEYRPVPSGEVNFESHNLEHALRGPN